MFEPGLSLLCRVTKQSADHFSLEQEIIMYKYYLENF